MTTLQERAVQATLQRYGLSKLATSPLRRAGAGFLSGALPGAVIGGVYGKMTASPDEDWHDRALAYGLKGALTAGSLNALRHGIKRHRQETGPQLLPAFDEAVQGFERRLAEIPDIPENIALRKPLIKQYTKAKGLQADARKALDPERTYLEALDDLISRREGEILLKSAPSAS